MTQVDDATPLRLKPLKEPGSAKAAQGFAEPDGAKWLGLRGRQAAKNCARAVKLHISRGLFDQRQLHADRRQLVLTR